jgi:hypothetical protein
MEVWAELELVDELVVAVLAEEEVDFVAVAELVVEGPVCVREELEEKIVEVEQDESATETNAAKTNNVFFFMLVTPENQIAAGFS